MRKVILYCSESLRVLLLSGNEQSKSCYFVLITLKALLCLLLASFLLCLPLGDPDKVYPPAVANYPSFHLKPNHYAISGYHFLCEVSKILSRAIIKLSLLLQTVIRYVWNSISNMLRYIKLWIYNCLDVVDREDLCKTVHCNRVPMVVTSSRQRSVTNCRKCYCGCR